MKVSKVIKKVEKALGVKVQQTNTGRYWAEYNGRVISWLGNGGNTPDAEACNFHVRRVDDVSDIQTDYFAGSFRDNATQMIHAVKPPQPKFKLGDLVEFKDNKRQRRYQQVGDVGIVVEVSEYTASYKIQKAGSAEVTGYESERDIKLVS